jgi:hypothetical protein
LPAMLSDRRAERAQKHRRPEFRREANAIH